MFLLSIDMSQPIIGQFFFSYMERARPFSDLRIQDRGSLLHECGGIAVQM